jgi:uncharacterized protein YkwD
VTGSSPHQGTDSQRSWTTVCAVTSVPAAISVRVVVSALTAVVALACLVVAQAEGATATTTATLVPAGVCRAADDPLASEAAQVRAVACVLNWARVKEGQARLSPRPALHRAATLKGRRVASCGQLSHTPCGSPVTSGITAVGYSFGWFGENLFAGSWRHVTAREVVNAWLQSPGHRENVLGSQFRHIGVAPVRAPGLLDGTDAVVWTATFASPR